MEVKEGVKLANYTTLGVGGSADFLVTASKSVDLLGALDLAYSKNIPFVILGSGSNVLVSDDGFRGLVIINKTRGYKISGAQVSVESGAMFSAVAKDTLEAGLIGLHYGAGIPGTLGGAICGNAGALGYQISETLVSAEVWYEGSIYTWEPADFEFAYRSSKIKKLGGFYIISAEFKLAKGDTIQLSAQIGEDKQRRGKSYVGRTAGSYFKNPEAGKTAGELIEAAGLKGFKLGGAEVSSQHANVLRNTGEATAQDFYELEKLITQKVKDKFGIILVSEVVKIGDFK